MKGIYKDVLLRQLIAYIDGFNYAYLFILFFAVIFIKLFVSKKILSIFPKKILLYYLIIANTILAILGVPTTYLISRLFGLILFLFFDTFTTDQNQIQLVYNLYFVIAGIILFWTSYRIEYVIVLILNYFLNSKNRAISIFNYFNGYDALENQNRLIKKAIFRANIASYLFLVANLMVMMHLKIKID